MAPAREPTLVRAVVAGDEIVAAGLADLTCRDGVRVARIFLLASFLGEDELDRRLKCALVVSLQAAFRRFQAERLEVWTDQDDDLARMILRRLGRSPTPGTLRTGAMPRPRLVRPTRGEGFTARARPSRTKASVTVALDLT